MNINQAIRKASELQNPTKEQKDELQRITSLDCFDADRSYILDPKVNHPLPEVKCSWCRKLREASKRERTCYHREYMGVIEKQYRYTERGFYKCMCYNTEVIDFNTLGYCPSFEGK